MELNFKAQVFYVVTDNELERFLMEVYNLPRRPEIAAMQELSSDQDDVYHVKPEILNRWELERLELFQRTGYASYGLHVILIDLCNRGLIKAGDYLLRVSG